MTTDDMSTTTGVERGHKDWWYFDGFGATPPPTTLVATFYFSCLGGQGNELLCLTKLNKIVTHP